MNLNHVAVFLAVAEHRSYTRAAEKLRVDKGQVSRIVKALEDELGVVLISRTTRSVMVTPAGTDLVARASDPIAALHRAAKALVDRPVAPSGEVTLATTPDIGRTLVAPWLPAFRARYPAVRLKLRLDQSLVNLAEVEADIALRVGKAGAGGLKARRLGELTAGFFASPRYLSARGTPRSQSELSGHDGLWPMLPKRQSFAMNGAPPPPVIDCDDFGALAELARAGAGIAVLPRYLAARDVAQGTLVEVVRDLKLPSAPLFLVTPKERPLPPRIGVLRDFLAAQLPKSLLSAG